MKPRTDRDRLRLICDEAVRRELKRGAFNASGAVNALIGAAEGGALGAGLASAAERGTGWRFVSGLSPLRREQLSSFLSGHGLGAEEAEGMIRASETQVPAGSDPASRRLYRCFMGFLIPAALSAVIGYVISGCVSWALPVSLILAALLIAAGLYLGMRRPGKAVFDAVWGKSRQPDEDISPLLERMLEGLRSA